MNPSLLYRILKSYCTLGLWFYFRSWQVAGKEKVPATGPLIFIANHQNAFLDAILMTCSASRNPYYLARANVFQKPWAHKLLTLLHLKPIYRFRDGFSTLKNNDIILQDCIDLLKHGEVILLFPEANHNEPWSMRIFQKGFARMAMMFHHQTQGAPLKIVPIGIHYTEHHSFNARVLVSYGEPLLVSKLVSKAKTERENLDTLVAAGEEAIKKLALDLKPEEEYQSRKKHLLDNRVYKANMLEQLKADRTVAASYPAQGKPASKNGRLQKMIATPFMLYILITHGLHYRWITSFIKKKIKDPQFISSVKYSFGIFTTPVYYVLICLLFYLITEDIKLSIVFLLSLPLSLVVYTKLQQRV